MINLNKKAEELPMATVALMIIVVLAVAVIIIFFFATTMQTQGQATFFTNTSQNATNIACGGLVGFGGCPAGKTCCDQGKCVVSCPSARPKCCNGVCATQC